MVKLEKQALEELLAAAPTDDVLAKAVAVLAAVGLSSEQIATALGLSWTKVEVLRQSETVIDMVLGVQVAMSMSPEQRLAAAVNMAIDVKMKQLASEDEKVKGAASTEILDRVQGKPVQTTQSLSVSVNLQSKGNVDSKLQALNERLARLTEKRNKLLGARNGDIISV
jgi:hypothetical protein